MINWYSKLFETFSLCRIQFRLTIIFIEGELSLWLKGKLLHLQQCQRIENMGRRHHLRYPIRNISSLMDALAEDKEIRFLQSSPRRNRCSCSDLCKLRIWWFYRCWLVQVDLVQLTWSAVFDAAMDNVHHSLLSLDHVQLTGEHGCLPRRWTKPNVQRIAVYIKRVIAYTEAVPKSDWQACRAAVSKKKVSRCWNSSKLWFPRNRRKLILRIRVSFERSFIAQLWRWSWNRQSCWNLEQCERPVILCWLRWCEESW